MGACMPPRALVPRSALIMQLCSQINISHGFSMIHPDRASNNNLDDNIALLVLKPAINNTHSNTTVPGEQIHF